MLYPDEPILANQGREIALTLLAGGSPTPLFPLGLYPLVPLFYSSLYVLVHDSLSWLVLVQWYKSLLIFVGCSWAFYGVAKLPAFRGAPRWVACLLLFLLPVIPPLANSSRDGLYAVFAACALLPALQFTSNRQPRSLITASVALAVAALVRTDAFVVWALLLILVTWLPPKGAETKTGWWQRLHPRATFTLTAPFMLIVGGYGLLAAHETGLAWTSSSAYVSFEQAEGVVYVGLDPAAQVVGLASGPGKARELYGTREENGESFIRAAMRNPKAFAKRVLFAASQAPLYAFEAYGGLVLGSVVWALALIGAVAQAKRRFWSELAVLAIWSVPLITYALFFYRAAYFLYEFYVVLPLAGLGTVHVARRLQTLTAARLSDRTNRLAGRLAWSLIVLGCTVAIILRQPSVPAVHTLGASANERVAAYLNGHYAPSTRVATFVAHGVTWSAGLRVSNDHALWSGANANSDAWPLLQASESDMVYLEPLTCMLLADAYESIIRLEGDHLTRVLDIQDTLWTELFAAHERASLCTAHILFQVRR